MIMTDFELIKLAKSDGVARVTFNKAKQHNVFNIEMMNQFIAVLEELIQDKNLKCVVLQAEGKSWCAGLDVGDHRPENADEMIAVFNKSLTLIGDFEIPTIAAVRGACLGGGLEYAIACDVIIASKRAKFGQPEIKLGFLPPYAAIRLPLLVGPSKTIEVCTSGKIYSADEARSMGFVSQTVEDEEFETAVDKFIGEIKANSPLIIRLNKRAVTQHLGMNFSDALEGVSDFFLNTLMKTEDTLEGIDSFYAKRRPEWKNK
jgi:cyclohexa-1,5-dienecarbonyl-CoA hydratase